MSGEYVFNFVPDAHISPIIVYPGEYNSALVSNKLHIIQTSSNEKQLDVFGDYTYRFTPGFQFTIVNSNINSGNFSVIESQYIPKTPISSIDGVLKTITFVGDGTRIFTYGRIFTIQSSTYNTGRWMAKSCTFDGVSTTIQLVASVNGDVVPPSVKDGTLIEPLFLDGYIETAITVIAVNESLVDSTNDGILEYYIPPDEVGSSLSIPGRGAPTPGEHINRNILDMLTNFASTSPPSNPISGQMWFDMTRMNVWNPVLASWVTVGNTRVINDRSISEPDLGLVLLPTPTYDLGTGVLSVYKNGFKLYPGSDYDEVTNQLISLTTPTQVGDKFMFEVLRLE